MVCLGLEPGAAGWLAQTNPLSYGGTPPLRYFNLPFKLLHSVTRNIILIFLIRWRKWRPTVPTSRRRHQRQRQRRLRCVKIWRRHRLQQTVVGALLGRVDAVSTPLLRRHRRAEELSRRSGRLPTEKSGRRPFGELKCQIPRFELIFYRQFSVTSNWCYKTFFGENLEILDFPLSQNSKKFKRNKKFLV